MVVASTDDSVPLSRREQRILAAIAEAVLPPGSALPGAPPDLSERVARNLGRQPAAFLGVFRAWLWAVEAAPLGGSRRRFTRLPVATRQRLLEEWLLAPVPWAVAIRVICTVLKMAHFQSEEVHRALGIGHCPEPVKESAPRYLRQVHDLASLERDDTIEAEVVVVGSGAGGAVVAKELAEKGHAVVLLEEGAYFRRADFAATPTEKFLRFYRAGGTTITLGGRPIPIHMGMTVGGTTTINSGTCERASEAVLARWGSELGLTELNAASLAPYYDRVESVLEVAPVRPERLSRVSGVVARGADRLGWRHGPLRRNAPDCDGLGHCAFGCPTDAKRSTNVSYVPKALGAGAQLYTRARVTRVLREGDRAVGVEAVAAGGKGRGPRPRLTVRAPVVVVACGALLTPALLWRSGLGGWPNPLRGWRSPLGQHLTVHPAVPVFAEFPEELRGWDGVPQGYAVTEFRFEGLMLEEGFPRLPMAASAFPEIGPSFMALMERWSHVAMLGAMIAETTRGRVVPAPAGPLPLILYHLNGIDTSRLLRGIERICRLFFSAGATRVYPGLPGYPGIRTEEELAPMMRSRFTVSDLELIAFHALGTARLGTDPRRSVVRPDHRCHDVRGLYVADGSAVPGPLGINPQLTIMALATRAAEAIDALLG